MRNKISSISAPNVIKPEWVQLKCLGFLTVCLLKVGWVALDF